MKKTHKPGEIAKVSGQYPMVGPKGGDTGQEVTVVKGEPFPPTEGWTGRRRRSLTWATASLTRPGNGLIRQRSSARSAGFETCSPLSALRRRLMLPLKPP